MTGASITLSTASHSPVDSGKPKPKPKKAAIRGSSFTPIEDVAIAKAWIAASENPIVGTEQKGNDFYSQIQKLYNDKFKPANRERRTMESVKTRCKSIHKECMAFSGCYARVVRSHPTGVSPNDMLSMATALYNGVQMDTVEDDCGKAFKFMQAWRVLRTHQKFLVAIEGSKETAVENSSPTNSTETDGETCKDEKQEGSARTQPKDERPVGRKRAKELQQKKEESAKKLRIAAEALVAQKERNTALKRHYEIMLFTNAPTSCDSKDAVEYFNIMRARALSDLRKEGNSTAPKNNQDAAEIEKDS